MVTSIRTFSAPSRWPWNNPGGATLGGTLTAPALFGVANFSGLTIDQLGSGYTLQATPAGHRHELDWTVAARSTWSVTNWW